MGRRGAQGGAGRRRGAQGAQGAQGRRGAGALGSGPDGAVGPDPQRRTNGRGIAECFQPGATASTILQTGG